MSKTSGRSGRARSKSSTHQYFWREIGFSNLENVANAIPYSVENLNQAEEDLLKEATEIVTEQMGALLKELIVTHFTTHQVTVITLYYFQYNTLQEVADQLGINYSGVNHSINGIWSVKHQTYHGGIRNKFNKIFQKDNRLKDLFELRNKLFGGDLKLAQKIYDEDLLTET